jgi:putative oxidoreductase
MKGADVEVALLVLRIGAGLLFAGHGAQKLFGWFGGNGLKGTGGFFEQNLGLSPGRAHAGAAGFNEFAGGLLLAFGLFTPLAAALIIATMTAAVLTVHAKNGPWVTDNGWELNALYGLIAFAAAGIGAGTISLDNALGLDVAGIGWAIGALVVGVAGGFAAVLTGRANTRRSAGGTGTPAATTG